MINGMFVFIYVGSSSLWGKENINVQNDIPFTNETVPAILLASPFGCSAKKANDENITTEHDQLPTFLFKILQYL